MCWKIIKGLFHKHRPIVTEADLELPKLKADLELPKLKPPRKWWQFPVRFVRTSRGGLNMPKFQPCSQCYSRSKRLEKTLGGANYFCRRHGRFFVRA